MTRNILDILKSAKHTCLKSIEKIFAVTWDESGVEFWKCFPVKNGNLIYSVLLIIGFIFNEKHVDY